MDKLLIITVGLPGSGKSTWAEVEKIKLEAQGVKVFISNKDELRKAMAATGWTWSPEAEKDVIKAQNQQIKGAYAQGAAVVIVADTNFGKHKDRLRGLAVHCDAEFQIKDFTDVPLQTCIERDANRPEPLRVGAQVITDMHNKYLSDPGLKPYVPDNSKNPAIICDLDGTLALHNGKRSPYDYKQVGEDDLNDPIARIVSVFARTGYTILYVSGREDLCRPQTEAWLAHHKLPVDTPQMLMMRKTGDHRKDYIVKQEIFDTYIRNNYNVRFVLDDRDQVVKMWRDMGLCCLQVNYGAF
jgi:predicted kinase